MRANGLHISLADEELHVPVRAFHLCDLAALNAYESVAQARASLGRYLDFYNRKRPHSSLDGRTPERAYFDHLPQLAAA